MFVCVSAGVVCAELGQSVIAFQPKANRHITYTATMPDNIDVNLTASKRTDEVASKSKTVGPRRLEMELLIGATLGGLISLMLFNDTANKAFFKFSQGIFGFGPRAPWLILPSGMLILFAVVVVHELGHLLGGRLAGFQPSIYQVGPLRWFWRSGRWRFTYVHGFNLFSGMAGGHSGLEHNLRWRLWWLIAAGPGANLITAILAWVLAMQLQPSPGPHPFGHAVFYLGSFALASVWMGGTNLIPRVINAGSLKGLMNDGYRLRRLARGGPEIEAELALDLLAYASLMGVRPRDWDQTLVHRASQSQPPDVFVAAGNQLGYFWALDRNDPEQARVFLERTLELAEYLPPTSRADWNLEVAFFAARFDQDLDRTREHFALGMAGPWHDMFNHARAATAIALATGRADDAAGLALAGLKANPVTGQQGVHEAELEWLEVMLNEAHALGSQISTPAVLPKPGTPNRAFNRGASFLWLVALVVSLGGVQIKLSGWFPRTALGSVISEDWHLVLPVMVMVLIVPLFAAIVARLGTLWMGRTVGFRLGAFHITGFWRIERINNRLRFGQNRVSSILGLTGLNGPEDARDLIQRTQRAVLGGWLGLVLVGLLILGLSFWVETPRGWRGLMRQIDSRELAVFIISALFLLECLGAGLLLVAACWLPSLLGVHLFEGGWRFTLLRTGGMDAERETARLAMLAAASRHVRPRDWCEAWVLKANQGEPLVQNDVHSLGCAYFWALDRSDIATAGKYLDQAIEHIALMPAPFNASFWLEKAYFEAAHRNDPQLARSMFNKVSKRIVEPTSSLRAEAAILIAEGHAAQALTAIQRARPMFRTSRNAGLIPAERDWLDALETQAQAALVPSSDVLTHNASDSIAVL